MSFGSKVEEIAGEVYGFFKKIGVGFVRDHGKELVVGVLAKAVTTVMGLQDIRDASGRPLDGNKKFDYAVSTIASYALSSSVEMARHEVETTIQAVFGATVGAGLTDLLEAKAKPKVIATADPEVVATVPPPEAEQLRRDILKWKNQIEFVKGEPESESKISRLAIKSEKVAIATARLAELVGT